MLPIDKKLANDPLMLAEQKHRQIYYNLQLPEYNLKLPPRFPKSQRSYYKITALHKAKKISQADLAKEAGVSREIIGRYERNEVSPSVDVAKKIADALEVSLDYLAGGSDKAAFDKQTLKLIDEIEELEPSTKDKLIFLANAIIRDAKTGKAYAH